MSTYPSFIALHDPSSQSRVHIAPERGAIVTSFVVAGRELLYLDESTLVDRTKNVRGGIPVLFPTPGKLVNDAWRRDAYQGALPQHGFARQLPWVVNARAESSATLILESNPSTLANFPWPFRATLTMSLSGTKLRCAFRLENIGSADLPYALGFHPYFRVADKQSARIATKATRVFNNVSKQVQSFAGFDFGAPEVDLHLLDHQDNVAVLSIDDESKIEVSASDDFGVWVVWSLANKEFICVEPWTAPGNAMNSGDRLITLASGTVRESWMDIAPKFTVSR